MSSGQALHLEQREQLVSDLVLPAVTSYQDRLIEDAAELEEQLEKQAARLDELRQKRESDAGALECLWNALHI